MMPITIVTVTFNAAAVIGRTLDSVSRQDYAAIEHIIIDGASTDSTVETVRRYAAEQTSLSAGRTVIVVSETDRGIYDAMNKGLNRASGQYVLFLNAGDTLHDCHTISTIVQTAEAHHTADGRLPAVVYGDTDIVDDAGTYLRPRRLRPPKSLSWRSFRSGMLVCHQAFYALVDIARATPYDLRYRLSADVDWCIRVMREAERRRLPLVNAQATLADYTEQGQTTINHRASLRERFDVMRRHYGLLPTTLMHIWFVLRAIVKH